MFFKNKYKPKFFGYFFLLGILKIIDGILTIIASPFHYEGDLEYKFRIRVLIKNSKNK